MLGQPGVVKQKRKAIRILGRLMEILLQELIMFSLLKNLCFPLFEISILEPPKRDDQSFSDHNGLYFELNITKVNPKSEANEP